MSSPFKFLKRFFFDQFLLGVDSGGGGGPTSSTVTQTNIPDWLRPQVEGLLGGATKQFFNTKEIPGAIDPTTGVAGPSTYEIVGSKPFTPYSVNPEDYVAGFSPLQQQVQYNAANLMMPSQFNQATGMAGAAGQGAMDSAQRAYGYGNAGFQSGQLGQQLGMQGGQYYGDLGAGYGSQAADIGQMGLRAEQTGQQIGNQAQDYAAQAARAGQQYAQQVTDPYAVQRYMSPYTQNVVDVQNTEAQRQADIASTYRGAQAARAGAFGGSRQAIENAEAARNLATLKNQNQAMGQQQAYQQAMQNMQYGSNLGLQGLSGAQQGLGTALQGGQLGLSGIGTALQGLQGGMQGAGMGLQGVNAQLAGTAQGMQGAGMGLQGVQGAQAGYGLANTAASNLANIGSQQLGAQTGILSLQNQVGGQQQAQEQRVIDNAINNYAQAQNAPLQNFNNYNALLRGYAVPGTTSTQYSAAPSFASQVVGGGTALLAGNKLLSPGGAAGGRPQDFRTSKRRDGLDSLAMYNTMRGVS